MNELDIMKIMNTIEYGWVDSNKQIYEGDLNDLYILRSPQELLETKHGICWEQVELERFLFSKTDLPFKTYFLCHYADVCPTHTFLVYEKDQCYYWFEHSWEKFRGIYKYNNFSNLINDVIDKFISTQIKGEYFKDNLILRSYDKPQFGISIDEFYKHCEAGKIVNFRNL